MKDNLNIEKLFKDKFENFEGNVKPDIWTNIANGVSSNAVVSSSIGFGVKALIIGVSAIAVGVTVYFVSDFNQTVIQETETVENSTHIEHDDIVKIKNINLTTTAVIIAEKNDPVILKTKLKL